MLQLAAGSNLPEKAMNDRFELYLVEIATIISNQGEREKKQA